MNTDFDNGMGTPGAKQRSSALAKDTYIGPALWDDYRQPTTDLAERRDKSKKVSNETNFVRAHNRVLHNGWRRKSISMDLGQAQCCGNSNKGTKHIVNSIDF